MTFHIFLVPIDVSLNELTLHEGQGHTYFDVDKALETLKLPPVGRYVLQAFKLHQVYQEEAVQRS